MTTRITAAGTAFLAFATWPGLAHAHAFGARYDLPLPLSLYLAGAGGTVAVTFLLLALFRRKSTGRAYNWDVALPGLASVVGGPGILRTVKALSVAIFVIILLTGLVGRQNTIHNLAPTLVWVIWWVGFTFFVCLVGNAWPAINPWTAVFDGFSSLFDRPTANPARDARFTLPQGIAHWPSVVGLMLFAWLELVSTAGEMPRRLACVIIVYSAITWTGMILYGRDRWLETGEPFHLYFGVLGRFAPLAIEGGQLVLRTFGAGLLTNRPVHVSMTLFVIVILSTVTFDGFVETPAWAGFLEWASESRGLRPVLLWLQACGVDLLGALKTIAFLLCVGLFFGVFRLFCAMSRALAGNTVTTSQLVNTLVFSLAPIAIAYHVSHYLSYLLLAGQLIIPLASDPFGWGWNLFGTAGYSMDIGIINAATVWYVALAAIVTGHVIAIWLAHEMALSLYGSARKALLSQIPMLMLMVLYTMSSLWILSQPITEF